MGTVERHRRYIEYAMAVSEAEAALRLTGAEGDVRTPVRGDVDALRAWLRTDSGLLHNIKRAQEHSLHGTTPLRWTWSLVWPPRVAHLGFGRFETALSSREIVTRVSIQPSHQVDWQHRSVQFAVDHGDAAPAPGEVRQARWHRAENHRA